MKVELGGNRAGAASAVNRTANRTREQRERAARNRVVMLQHGEAPSGQLLDVLVEHGLEPLVVRADAGDDLPDPASMRGCVMVGMDRFGDARERGYLDAELQWLRRADQAGTPVLGLGHGARALAVAFGGGVEPAERPIRGWVMVDTEIPHQIATGPWLTWQHDVITLPPHARVLAHNRLGPQAFRLGRHLGVQFHPEATPATLAHSVTTRDHSLDARTRLAVIARDPKAAASCTRRLFLSFIGTLALAA
jgi:GMP synthase-like glutamine amidotransferase